MKKYLLILITFISTLFLASCDFGSFMKEMLGIEDDEPQHKVDTIEGIVYDDLQIHFLELGNKYAGDSVYIKAGDTDILIDAGSRASSASTIKSYVDNYCTDNKLEYVIATHAHQDHIEGFVGNIDKNNAGGRDGIFYQYEIGTLIDFSMTNSTATVYNNYLDAIDYITSKGTKHYSASDSYDNKNGANRKYEITDKISFEILYNYYYYHESDDENNYSVCILLTYNDSNEIHKFIFTGDLEEAGEELLSEYYKNNDIELIKNVELYKGGHHGSKTSSNECLLEIINPQVCCVCCCAGTTEYTKNRVNTFPTQQFIDRISKYTDKVYVTSMYDEETDSFMSMNGNIIISCGMVDEMLEDGTSKKSYKLGIAATNNTTKLKDTTWFSHTVYVDSNDKIVDKSTPKAKAVPCRTLPSYWK